MHSPACLARRVLSAALGHPACLRKNNSEASAVLLSHSSKSSPRQSVKSGRQASLQDSVLITSSLEQHYSPVRKAIFRSMNILRETDTRVEGSIDVWVPAQDFCFWHWPSLHSGPALMPLSSRASARCCQGCCRAIRTLPGRRLRWLFHTAGSGSSAPATLRFQTYHHRPVLRRVGNHSGKSS